MTKDEFWDAFGAAAQGLSARQLADKLGVPHSNAYRWRERVSAPSKVSRRFIVAEMEKQRALMLAAGEKGEAKDADGFPVEMTKPLCMSGATVTVEQQAPLGYRYGADGIRYPAES